MSTTKKIADTLKQHLADVADRGKLFGQAFKVRADMAAIRRRLRTTYAELGEEVYRRLLRDGELDGDHQLSKSESTASRPKSASASPNCMTS